MEAEREQDRIIGWRELEYREVEQKIADYERRLERAKRNIAILNDALQTGSESRHLQDVFEQSRKVDWHGFLDVLVQLPTLYETRDELRLQGVPALHTETGFLDPKPLEHRDFRRNLTRTNTR